MGQSGMTLDLKPVIADLRRYDKETKKRFSATLATNANVLIGKQWTHLHSRVKQWTGKLGGSLSAKKTGNYTWEVGPQKYRVVYAWWIEEGGLGTAFKGYHYVRDTLKPIESKLTRELKKVIEQSARY